LQQLGTDCHSTIPAITTRNTKTLLLSLPAELRVRIFEYVLGQAHYNVMSSDMHGKRLKASFFRCRFDVCHVGRPSQRASTGNDLTGPGATDSEISPPTFGDEIRVRNHDECSVGYQKRYNRWKHGWKHTVTDRPGPHRRYEKGPLPTTLLLTCKQIHNDAAMIFWRNNTFLMDLQNENLSALASHMTPAQRKAVRSIAVSFIGGPSDRHDLQRPTTSYEDLLN
jgi:hypothetical protein